MGWVKLTPRSGIGNFQKYFVPTANPATGASSSKSAIERRTKERKSTHPLFCSPQLPQLVNCQSLALGPFCPPCATRETASACRDGRRFTLSGNCTAATRREGPCLAGGCSPHGDGMGMGRRAPKGGMAGWGPRCAAAGTTDARSRTRSPSPFGGELEARRDQTPGVGASPAGAGRRGVSDARGVGRGAVRRARALVPRSM